MKSDFDKLKLEIFSLENKYKYLKELKLNTNIVGSPPSNKFKKNKTFKTNAFFVK